MQLDSLVDVRSERLNPAVLHVLKVLKYPETDYSLEKVQHFLEGFLEDSERGFFRKNFSDGLLWKEVIGMLDYFEDLRFTGKYSPNNLSQVSAILIP